MQGVDGVIDVVGYGDIGVVQFGDFICVCIDVNDVGEWCEFCQFVGGMVVEVCVQYQQQVVFLYCYVGCVGFVYVQYVQ